MFVEQNFEKDGKIIPQRFIKIEDLEVIAELEKLN